MVTKINQIIHGSFWAFIQLVFLQAGTLIVTMFLTRMLTTSEYGVIPLINSLILMFIVFVGLGVPSSMARYLSFVDEKYAQKQLIQKAISVYSVWFIIICSIIYLVIPYIAEFLSEPKLLELRWLFIPVLSLELFRAFLEKLCHGTGNMKISASFSGWISLSIILLTVPLVFNSPTAEMAFIAKIIAFVIPSLRAIMSLNKALSQKVYDNVLLPSNIDIAKYGLPLAMISLSGFGFVQIDLIFLAYYEDTSSVGLYSVGVLLLIKLTAISKAIGFGVSPFYAKKDKNHAELSKFFMYGLKFSLMVAIPSALLLMVEAEYVMSLLFGSYYEMASDTVRLLCLYFLMTSIMAISSPVLDFGGKAKVRAYAALFGATLNIIFNVILIPEYGLLGAALGTVIGYLVFFLITMRSVHNMRFLRGNEKNQVVLLIFIVAPIILLTMVAMKWILEGVSFWGNALILVILYPVMLVALGVVTKKEVQSLKRNFT